MKYLYYALFTPDDEGKIEVTFPDLAPNAATYGNDVSDALDMAHDSLEGYLLTVEDFKELIQKPSNFKDIKHSDNQLLVPINVDTTIARDREANKAIKKTLTIPRYLNDLGKENGINFSAMLTNALKDKLQVK